MDISLAQAMENNNQLITLISKHPKVWQLLYWLLSALVLFFVFTNNGTRLNIRVMLVLSLILMSFSLAYFINYYLIPRFLFTGKYFRFFYLSAFAIVLSVWINYLSVLTIIWYQVLTVPQSGLPGNDDVILLISGNYLIILLAAFIHFLKEAFRKSVESERIGRQKAEAELKLKEVRLRMLQGQLHPHFLFNMLNNLYGLWMENSAATPDVILKLSSMLDFMLYECNQTKISLGKEIRLIRDFIDLEILRHDTRLFCDIKLPEANHGPQVAPLIFFTFIENAFKHGVDKTSGESFVKVAMSLKGYSVEMIVENSVTGSCQPLSANGGTGIGLMNVNERLNLLYPGKYSLKIECINGVFSVCIELFTD